TPLDVGTKIVRISLHPTGDTFDETTGELKQDGVSPPIEFTFSVPVPGLTVDYLRRNLTAPESTQALIECDAAGLVKRLAAMRPTTSNRGDSRSGDPVNLAVVGEFETLLGAFAARWDESETITLETCWKTFRAFLLGSQYRYSPVSALYLF